MEYRILGPLEVVDGGDVVEVGTAKQQALLAVLLLHADELVSRERLIDAVWGPAPPATAAKAVQVYVSRLRKALARTEHDSIVTRSPGYVFALDGDVLDAAEFRRLVREARAQMEDDAFERAAELFRRALALWRGPPVQDVPLDASCLSAVGRLEEERSGAVVDLVECELALGRYERVIAELKHLTHEDPLREQLRVQLMRALYGAGRQAEALRVYDDARTILATELGLEPGPDLKALQRAILNQEPALVRPRRPSARAGPEGLVHVPRRRRSRRLVVAAALAAVAVIAAVGLVRTGPADSIRVEPNSVAVIEPSTGRVVADIPVGNEPGPLVVAFGSAWVGNLGDQTVSRIDIATRKVERTIPLAAPPDAVAATRTRLWFASTRASELRAVEPRFEQVSATVRLPHVARLRAARTTFLPTALAAGRDSLWVGSVRGKLLRLDPTSGKIVNSVELFGLPARGLAITARGTWMTHGRRWRGGTSPVTEVDPRTGSIAAQFPAGREPVAIAAGKHHVWVVDDDRRSVLRVDADTRSVTGVVRLGDRPSRPACPGPSAVARDATSVWVADRADRTVVRIDPRTSTVVSRARLSACATGLAVGGGAVWATITS